MARDSTRSFTSAIRPAQKLALAALVEVAGDADEFLGVREGAVDSLGKLAKGSKRA